MNTGQTLFGQNELKCLCSSGPITGSYPGKPANQLQTAWMTKAGVWRWCFSRNAAVLLTCRLDWSGSMSDSPPNHGTNTPCHTAMTQPALGPHCPARTWGPRRRSVPDSGGGVATAGAISSAPLNALTRTWAELIAAERGCLGGKEGS